MSLSHSINPPKAQKTLDNEPTASHSSATDQDQFLTTLSTSATSIHVIDEVSPTDAITTECLRYAETQSTKTDNNPSKKYTSKFPSSTLLSPTRASGHDSETIDDTVIFKGFIDFTDSPYY
jgi:hypothetical protein